MQARRLRVCPAGHTWDFLAHQDPSCPTCGGKAGRAYASLLLRAGRRGGKTRAGALAVIEEAAQPNKRIWCCAPTYPKLNDYVLPAFFQQMPQAWLAHRDTDWSESELTLTLPNRTQVQFRSLEDPDRGRGPGLDVLWIDEICELSLKHWETIEPALADRGGIAIFTTSPKGEDWVHETFYEPAEKAEPGYWACSFTTLDNPSISPEFVARARARMSPLMFRQEYLAEIVTFTGAIYGDAVDRCVIEGTDAEMQFYFPEWPALDIHRPFALGLDPGTDHPFAAVPLVASPKGLVVTDYYEERNRPYQLHAEHILPMLRGLTGRHGIDRSQAQGQIELAQYGLFTMPAENDVIAGINRVTAWMLAAKRTPEQPLPVGGLVLPRRYCSRLIKSLRAYRWAENNKKDGQTSGELVYKKNDDGCDGLRYGLMIYPTLPADHPLHADGQRRNLAATDLPENVRHDIERERKSRDAEANEDGLEAISDDYVADGMGDFSA